MKKIFVLLSVVFAMLSLFIPYDQMGYAATLLQKEFETNSTEVFIIGGFLPLLPIMLASLFMLLVLALNRDVSKGLESRFLTIVSIGLLLIVLPIILIKILIGASFGAPVYNLVYFGIYIIITFVAFVIYQVRSGTVLEKDFATA